MHAEKPTTFTERYTPLHSSVDEQPPQTVQTNSEISVFFHEFLHAFSIFYFDFYLLYSKILILRLH